MSSNKNGFINQKEMVQHLNNRKVSELNENMKNFIFSIFKNISLNSLIKAGEIGGQLKPDCYIEFNGERKNISLKMGKANSIHQELLNIFCDFLKQNNVSDESIQTIRLFNYGDGTIDGSGSNRLSAKQYYSQNQLKIDKVNREINSNKDLLKQLIKRFIFKGINDDNPSVDITYHGTINEGIWVTKDEITDYLINETQTRKGIHFSSLTYQVWNRCLNYNPTMEYRRHIMQIKWSSMVKDAIEIKSRRKNNNGN